METSDLKRYTSGRVSARQRAGAVVFRPHDAHLYLSEDDARR